MVEFQELPDSEESCYHYLPRTSDEMLDYSVVHADNSCIKIMHVDKIYPELLFANKEFSIRDDQNLKNVAKFFVGDFSSIIKK